MNPKIKIYIINHLNFKSPEHPIFYPIQVGAALKKERFPGMIADDTGNNISNKNRAYCELTAQYWAWKNDEADYYGFFHYRRYLSLNRLSSKPYFYLKSPSEKEILKLGFNKEESIKFISRFSIIVPMAEEMHESLYNYYKRHHHVRDLDIIINIIQEKYPQYKISMEEYLQDTKAYFCNIFIAIKNIFFDYCNWVFSILEEFERRSDKTGYSKNEMRVEGFLAEYLFGIYYTQLVKNKSIKSIELNRVDFLIGNKRFVKNKFLYALFPPESKRRFLLKKVFFH